VSDLFILGIDIGTHGAISRFSVSVSGAAILLDVDDMPVLRDGPAGRPAVNAPLLAEIAARSHASKAFVEGVGARPGEGAVGAFSFGRSRGCIEGVLGALAVPVSFIAPAQWKRLIGIPPGKEGAKDAARSEAIRRWPDKAMLFARVKDDGRAEDKLDSFEGAMLRGAALALRRRADRQAKIAKEGTTAAERGVVFRTGEGVLAERLAAVLAELAAEFEGAAR
jgi:crossover junction endodeoxyribonuclease RuvC